MDTFNQTLVRGKELSDHVYDTLKYFCQTKEYNENVWLLLTTLNHMGKEKHKLRDVSTLLKYCLNDLKLSMCALK